MTILQVNDRDEYGGAEKIASTLFCSYRKRGHNSYLAVGHKTSNDSDIFQISGPQHSNSAGSVFFKWNLYLRNLNLERGGENSYYFPATRLLLNLAPKIPDIIHCHNLHGGYFDLRALPWLSKRAPVILTLHDAWLLGGHCVHSFDCEKWKSGCGECPDLLTYPAIRQDATSQNWQYKRKIYAKSHFFIATPSHWLMNKVRQSILMKGMVECRVIPNGVDLSVFRVVDQRIARSTLNIPQDVKMLLFAANGIKNNTWKDYQVLKKTVALVADRMVGEKILFVALGEDSPPEKIGQSVIRFIPYERNPEVVAEYYQAADVYIHAARADTFPNAVLEALVCGTPVVATGVGGIPEQIENGSTGFIVPPGDAESMAARVVEVLTSDGLRDRMRIVAAESARRRFDLNRQTEEYLAWYKECADARQLSV